MAKRLLVIVVLAATTSGPVVGRQILNGAFDEDLTGWNVPSPPNTEIAWDSFGEPAGSLRVTTSRLLKKPSFS